MEIAVIGGGVAGLSLALNLHKHGLTCRVYESAPEVRELGVGITLLPHAMKEFTDLGLQDELAKVALETQESCFFNRFGQLIYREPRGRYAGYKVPEFSIHRGRLHLVLHNAAVARLGRDRVLTNHHCVGLEQDDSGVTLSFTETSTRAPRPPVRADIAIACDGVNSAVRRQFYPDEKLAFAGINTWRGVTKWPPIRTGRSYMRIGSINTGKLVVYPIIDDVDGQGNQLINWMAEIQMKGDAKNDWNKPGKLGDFYRFYQSWTFEWCDVAAMIRAADMILEYPMVDKDPVERWTFGRVTLAGDAAHPMYPRGSTGAAQGAVDARTLADCIAATGDPVAALQAYEEKRLAVVNNIVLTNRKFPPDYINIKVEELVGDRPFDDLDKYITQDELRALSDRYKGVAGYSLQDLGR